MTKNQIEGLRILSTKKEYRAKTVVRGPLSGVTMRSLCRKGLVGLVYVGNTTWATINIKGLEAVAMEQYD